MTTAELLDGGTIEIAEKRMDGERTVIVGTDGNTYVPSTDNALKLVLADEPAEVNLTQPENEEVSSHDSNNPSGRADEPPAPDGGDNLIWGETPAEEETQGAEEADGETIEATEAPEATDLATEQPDGGDLKEAPPAE